MQHRASKFFEKITFFALTLWSSFQSIQRFFELSMISNYSSIPVNTDHLILLHSQSIQRNLSISFWGNQFTIFASPIHSAKIVFFLGAPSSWWLVWIRLQGQTHCACCGCEYKELHSWNIFYHNNNPITLQLLRDHLDY